MIFDWFAQSGLFALALIVVFVPGLLLGAGLRLRGLVLWGAAPGVSVGILALLAIVFPFLGIRWGHGSVAVGVLLIAAAVFGLSLLFRSRRRGGWARTAMPRHGLLLWCALVVGGGLNAARLMTYVGVPTAISQTNDAVFHLNALRWVAETGSASSLDLSGLIDGSSFYPAAWHAVASLVALDNGQIPIAANVVALVIVALVWPLSIALLTHVVTRGDRVVTALAAALSAGLLAFPQLMFEWGVLYPYALSLAVVPAAVAFTIVTLRCWLGARRGERFRVAVAPGFAALLLVVATTLAQPSSVLVWGIFVMLWLTGMLVRRLRQRRQARLGALATIAVGWAAIAVVWLALAYLAGPVLWKAYRGVLGAVADVLLNSHSLLPPAIGMSVLMIVGILICARDARLRWLVIGWVGVSVLYVVSVATDLPVVKRLLTGPWYGDSFRLAAIVPLVVVPIAAIGLAALIDVIVRRWRRGTVPGRVPLAFIATAVVAVIGVVSVVVAPVIPLRVAAKTDPQSRYALNDRSYLSADESALLRRLPDLLPEDALIIANPSTGAAFAYLLGERDIIPRTWSPPQSTAWDILSSHLNDAADDPDVCSALDAYGSPGYVLDFGRGGTGPGQYLMPGMTDFDGKAGFEEVDREGRASLWRITACD